MNLNDCICVTILVIAMVVLGEAQNRNCLRNKSLEPPALNFDSFLKTPETTAHPCLRNCTDSASMVCEYTFHVEWYYTMAKACYDCPCNTDDCNRAHCVAADGVPRSIIVANRTLPGPPIEVCEGDQVIVTAVNHMDNGEAITLHWHGLYQKNNQYMDGVFMVSQCPIVPHDVFRYNFTADHPGTHWWHAHTGMHRADGLFGALIIRQSNKSNPHYLLYDYDLPEHKVVLNDWMHEGTVGVYLNHHFRGTDDEPVSILINGKGASAVYGNASTSAVTPREVYEVQQGKRYRFRVISSGITNIPLKVSVDGHNITLISSDGDDFQPLEVDAFFIYGGERYDFILNASQEIGNYWLKAKGYKQGTGLFGLAVIRYQGAGDAAPTAEPSEDRQGDVYQDMARSYVDPDAVTTVNELRSLLPRTPRSNKTDRRVYLPLDLQWINNPMFNDPELYPLGPGGPGWGDFLMPQINRRTYVFTDFPLMSQFEDELAAEGAYDDNLCEVDQAGFDDCDTRFCACTQFIKVDVDQRLEIILIDESNSPFDIEHPFHLHGHAFRVLAQRSLGYNTTREEVMKLDENGGIVRNYNHPAMKDTVIVPRGGYTVIEFVADNPGWWMLHCHMEYHLEDGMGIIIRVGNQSDLPPVPEGFPKCGDFPPLHPASSTIPNTIVTNISDVVITLIVVIVFLALIVITLIVVIVCRGRSSNDGKGRPQRVPMNDQK